MGENRFLELIRNQVWYQDGYKLESTFHPLETPFNTFSLPRGNEYTLVFLNSFPPPHAENQFPYEPEPEFLNV
jgi:hypothetical protein